MEYRSYRTAYYAVQKISEIVDRDTYDQFRHLDPRLPPSPQRTFKGKGWVDFPTFINGSPPAKRDHGVINGKFIYERCVKEARRHGASSSTDYRERVFPLDDRFPKYPEHKYKRKGWVDWETFCGMYHYRRTFEIPYYTYGEFCALLSLYKVQYEKDYAKIQTLDPRLPPRPREHYELFRDWHEDLYYPRGLMRKHTPQDSFESFRAYIHTLKLTSAHAYRLLRRKRRSLPYDPQVAYPEEWRGWPDFIGPLYDPEAKFRYKDDPERFYTYPQAREKVAPLKLRSVAEYQEWRKKVQTDESALKLPRDPKTFYMDSWISWFNYLSKHQLYLGPEDPTPANWKPELVGKGRYRRYTYDSAKRIAQDRMTTGHYECLEDILSTDEHMPPDPAKWYKGQWEGCDIFLGLYRAYQSTTAR